MLARGLVTRRVVLQARVSGGFLQTTVAGGRTGQQERYGTTEVSWRVRLRESKKLSESVQDRNNIIG